MKRCLRASGAKSAHGCRAQARARVAPRTAWLTLAESARFVVEVATASLRLFLGLLLCDEAPRVEHVTAARLLARRLTAQRNGSRRKHLGTALHVHVLLAR